MLQGEHSEILLTFIKLPFVIKVFVLFIFEWLLKTGFTVYNYKYGPHSIVKNIMFKAIVSVTMCSWESISNFTSLE